MNLNDLLKLARAIEEKLGEDKSPKPCHIFSKEQLPEVPEYREAGKRVAERILRNEADAEEAADQAVMEVQRQPEVPADGRVAVEVTARRRALDQLKKKKKTAGVNSEAVEGAPAVRATDPQLALEAEEYLALLDRALVTLPIDDRRPARLYYREGESVVEISRRLGIGYGLVYQSLGRSRPRLLAQLPAEYHENLRPFPERPRQIGS